MQQARISEQTIEKIIQDSLQEVVDGQHDPEINVSIRLESIKPDAWSVTYHLYPNDCNYYPASLIKLFHAYLAKHKLQDKASDLVSKHKQDPDLLGVRTYMDDVYDAIDAALRLSDNDALSFLVDFNTGTASGPRLDAAEFALFKQERDAVTRFFKAKGYSPDLNIPGKCFSFAPYGREVQLSLEENGLGRNNITINDVAQIIEDIAGDYPELYDSFRRRVDNTSDEQCQFIAKGLLKYKDQIKGYASKAGWTSTVRHDIAHVGFKSDQEYVLIIFTKNLSVFEDLIPSISEKIFNSLFS